MFTLLNGLFSVLLFVIKTYPTIAPVFVIKTIAKSKSDNLISKNFRESKELIPKIKQRTLEKPHKKNREKSNVVIAILEKMYNLIAKKIFVFWKYQYYFR